MNENAKKQSEALTKVLGGQRRPDTASVNSAYLIKPFESGNFPPRKLNISSKLMIISFGLKIDENTGLKYVQGELKNISNALAIEVLVSFDLYDNEANLVGRATELKAFIKAGENWKFSALVPNANVDKAELVRLTCQAP